MDAPPIRVLHVLDSLAPGGLENGVVNVARRLQGNGFDIHAACLRLRGEFAERMPRPDQVAVMGKTQGFSWSAVRALHRHARKTGAQVLHSHNLGTLIYAALASFGGRVWPIVHGEHGQIQPQDLSPKRIWQRRWFFRLCHSVHVVSGSLKDNLHALGLDHVPIIVTPNGVDSERFAPSASKAEARRAAGFDAQDRVIGIVGRLVALKRHRLLFDAFGKLAPVMPELRLLVVGDGGVEKENILQAMHAHPFSGRIKWVGHQDDVKPFYQSMDLLAVPSEIEGLSNAVLEAMACGTPVLGHSACGNAEVMRDGENGFLAHLQTANDLATALREALSDEAKLARCAVNARHTVEQRFSMEAMAECYRQLYRSAARSKAS